MSDLLEDIIKEDGRLFLTTVRLTAIMRTCSDVEIEKGGRHHVTGSRGKGIATKILSEMERWAAELGYARCILETGKRQPEAIQLYRKNAYAQIPNFGQYAGIENSLCFEKKLKNPTKTTT